MGKKPLGIYIHIPFCVRKCNYCDFLSAPAEAQVRHRYVDCLKEEIDQFEDGQEYRVRSVFFGGGTPSLLEGEEIAALMEALRRKFDFMPDSEITVECNPGTLTPDKLSVYRDCGINRLSLGLQSADDRELKLLGRIHTWEMFEENFREARKIGFGNINVDLMSALPGQTVSSWQKTLGKVLALEPEHISAYSLIIEEGTPFYQWYGEEDAARARGAQCAALPSEEEERQMYYDTERVLTEAGLYRYEISNYAKPGYESRHNSGYWQRIEYAGFGLGSASQLKSLRYKNTDNLTDYLNGDYAKREMFVLTKDDQIEETMYLGLRMMRGVDLKEFQNRFGVSVRTVYSRELEKLEREGLIMEKAGRLCLTRLGIDVSNRVLSEFLLD